jgi:starch synthase
MADVALEALPTLLAQGTQIIVHGQGDKSLESAFVEAGRHYEGQLAVRIGYQEELARRLNAAGDLSLTASRFEPCGLTTMHAMRYGALPVTRAVGGLADTVVDPDSPSADALGGTGFLFADETPQAMSNCVARAVRKFRQPDWRALQRSAMKRDFGWATSSRRYLDVYNALQAPIRASQQASGRSARYAPRTAAA